MSRELDHTRPGPAGLYFDPSRLTPAGWQQEMAARARLETHCTICGTIPAPYGYGRHAACDEIDCRSEAKARMEADRLGEGTPASPDRPREPAPPVSPSLDLFSPSEAA